MDIKSWYRDRLPARIAALEEVRRQLKSESPESIEAVRRIAHSLRGSGSTFGFPEVTDSARLLEETAEDGLLEAVDSLIRTLGRTYTGTPTDHTSILIVEDDEDQSAYLAEALSGPDREVLQARSAEEAQALLDRREVSLILLDLILPDMDGRNFLSRLRGHFATARIPVIVLTVKRASQARAECFALGADDFLEKPVKADALHETVEARLRLGSGLARELSRDPLTGLPNRAAFTELFHRQRNGVLCSQEPTTAAMIVLDFFDTIVEKHGPDVADELVRHAAKVLTRSFRSSDILARFTGCEFMALFPRTSARGVGIALSKALQELRGTPYRHPHLGSLPLSFSAGIAPLDPGKSLEDVLAEADRTLYLAQDAGGGRGVSALDRVPSPRKKILIADDDELIRMVLQRLFEREGYETLLCPHGKAALQRAKEGPVSLVVTDGSMPVMDGFELVGKLRQLPGYAQTPVMMLTSMGNEADIVRGFDLGADDYVIKPFSSGELLARVRRLLKRAPSPR